MIDMPIAARGRCISGLLGMWRGIWSRDCETQSWCADPLRPRLSRRALECTRRRFQRQPFFSHGTTEITIQRASAVRWARLGNSRAYAAMRCGPLQRNSGRDATQLQDCEVHHLPVGCGVSVLEPTPRPRSSRPSEEPDRGSRSRGAGNSGTGTGQWLLAVARRIMRPPTSLALMKPKVRGHPSSNVRRPSDTSLAEQRPPVSGSPKSGTGSLPTLGLARRLVVPLNLRDQGLLRNLIAPEDG